MEVKINREIRNYSEQVYFGLNLRQFIFSLLACGVAVGLYFLLKPIFGMETLSWLCILGAIPFALLGFFNWHGMNAEQAFFAYIKSEFIMPKELKYISVSIYDSLEMSTNSNQQKETKLKGAKNVRSDGNNNEKNRSRRPKRRR